MSSLKTNEKNVLEKLFQMNGGGVLDFTHRTFGEFFQDNFDVDIHSDIYNYASGSKANLMRGFWNVADDLLVSKVILELMNYIENQILLDFLKEEDFPVKLKQKASEIANDLMLKNTKDVSQDEEIFLQEEFKDIEIKIKDLDQANFDVISHRMNEIEKCLQNMPFWDQDLLQKKELML